MTRRTPSSRRGGRSPTPTRADAIAFSRSDDGGQTWSKAKTLWAAPGRPFLRSGHVGACSSARARCRRSCTTAPPSTRSGRRAGFATNPDDARIVVSSSRDGRHRGVACGDRQYQRTRPPDHSAGRGRGRTHPGRLDRHAQQRSRSFDRFIADFRYIDMGSFYQRIPLAAPVGTAPNSSTGIRRTSTASRVRWARLQTYPLPRPSRATGLAWTRTERSVSWSSISSTQGCTARYNAVPWRLSRDRQPTVPADRQRHVGPEHRSGGHQPERSDDEQRAVLCRVPGQPGRAGLRLARPGGDAVYAGWNGRAGGRGGWRMPRSVQPSRETPPSPRLSSTARPTRRDRVTRTSTPRRFIPGSS